MNKFWKSGFWLHARLTTGPSRMNRLREVEALRYDRCFVAIKQETRHDAVATSFRRRPNARADYWRCTCRPLRGDPWLPGFGKTRMSRLLGDPEPHHCENDGSCRQCTCAVSSPRPWITNTLSDAGSAETSRSAAVRDDARNRTFVSTQMRPQVVAHSRASTSSWKKSRSLKRRAGWPCFSMLTLAACRPSRPVWAHAVNRNPR